MYRTSSGGIRRSRNFSQRRHRDPFDGLLLCGGALPFCYNSNDLETHVEEEELVDEVDDSIDLLYEVLNSNLNTNTIVDKDELHDMRFEPIHSTNTIMHPLQLLSPPPSRVMSPSTLSTTSTYEDGDVDNDDDDYDFPLAPLPHYYHHHNDRGNNINQHDRSGLVTDKFYSQRLKQPIIQDSNDSAEDQRKLPSSIPSFFSSVSSLSPWMCVFDLDTACGGDNSNDETSIPNHNSICGGHHKPSSSYQSSTVLQQQQRQPCHNDCNQFRIPNVDVSQWFTSIENLDDDTNERDGSNLPLVYSPKTTAKSTSSYPLSPTSVIRDIPVTATNFLPTPPDIMRSRRDGDHNNNVDRPTIIPFNHSSFTSLVTLQHQYFTNFATDADIETIYIESSSTAFATTSLADEVGNNARRRAPTAQTSMSLTPAAAAQLTKKVTAGSSGRHEHHYHGRDRSEEFRASGDGNDVLDLVQVRTPGADRSALKELPSLRDSSPTKREELFVLKLKLCSVIFSFDDPTAEKRGKDMKRQTLLELVDYVNTPAGQKVFTESIMGELMAMVSANVCRALPPVTDDFDPEEDEPVLEPAWPHLQVAYEFFLRFIVSSEVNAKAAKKYVDQKFCLQLVELFDSEDPRERDYLKTILHRIYGKFMSHRSFIRRAISNVFYRFVYETERHNGIGELLEILGSIINGFAIPLKKEHLQFLVRALIPLHKPKCVALYHQQLSYCIIQYVEKDADTATPILNGFFKCWPWSCSGKQVMFLNELEEILELLGADQLAQVSNMLFTNLARCLDCDHFQVVERALFLWNNEHLINSGCLSRLNAHTVLPIIYGPLYKNSSGHWNATVEGLAQNVLKMYMEYDLALYDKCTSDYFRDEEEAKKRLEALSNKWHAIEQEAFKKAPEIMAK